VQHEHHSPAGVRWNIWEIQKGFSRLESFSLRLPGIKQD
jgi:hypothetical protein